MDAENILTATHVRTSHHNTAIKAARTQQGWIQHVGPVSGSNKNHSIVRFKTVHFDEQLVQRLLTLVVPAAETRAAMTSNSVNFVDKDDAGSILLALFEEVANAACAYTHEHFNEVRA